MANQLKSNMPIYKEKAGAMSISVFENKGKAKDGTEYVFKTVNLQKSYKDKDGEWQNSDISLRVDDISRSVMLLGMAFERCTLKEKVE